MRPGSMRTLAVAAALVAIGAGEALAQPVEGVLSLAREGPLAG